MSEIYQRIILVIDGPDNSNVAEQTAVNLAKTYGGSVLVVDTIRPRSSVSKWLTSKYDDHFNEFVVKKQDRLEGAARRIKNAGADADAELLFGRPSDSIERRARTWEADLVVRFRNGEKNRPHVSGFDTTARTLMRICPCPLLLVDDEAVTPGAKTLACIDAENPYAENAGILESAKRIAGEKKNLLAAYCWCLNADKFRHQFETDNLHPEILTGQTELCLYREEAREQYWEIYDRFVKQFDLSSYPGGLHLETGRLSEAIPKLCRQECVDVVVMSSESRSYLLQMLRGSAVESAMEDVPCALLITKPTDFDSPVNTHSKKKQRVSKYDGATIKQNANRLKAHVSIFDDVPTAQRATAALHDAGFLPDQVELVVSDDDIRVHGIESPKDREMTGDCIFENAAKWSTVGAAAGGLSIVLVPFPGLVLGMVAFGGLLGAIVGSIAGVDHAAKDDSVDLPTLDEYEELVRYGKCLLVVRGTHSEVIRIESIVSNLIDARSHVFTLHGHQFHEHTYHDATVTVSKTDSEHVPFKDEAESII